MSAGAKRPCCTPSSVPVIMRTMLYRKPSAATVKRTMSPSRVTRLSVTVREKSPTSRLSSVQNEVKSWRPMKCCAAASSLSASIGW